MTPHDPMAFTLDHEGGLVDDPDDPGGATNHGISFRFLKTLDPSLADLDQDGDVDPDDIRGMTQDQARLIYMDRFYNPLKIYQYPAPVGIALLDTAVNMGRFKAVVLLQRALDRSGFRLKEDGIVGPRTMAMVRGMDATVLVRMLIFERMLEYVRLCFERPTMRKFLFGWACRCRDLEQFTTRMI